MNKKGLHECSNCDTSSVFYFKIENDLYAFYLFQHFALY